MDTVPSRGIGAPPSTVTPPAATSGVVTVEPQGITLRPNVGSCDGTVCLVEDLTGPITLVPSTSDPLAFFMGWEPGVCDAIDGQECQLDLEADVDIEASFGTEG